MPMTVYAVNIRGVESARIAPCRALLAPERAARADRFHFEVDRVRGILGETLIRYLAVLRTGLANDRLAFARTERGKPYLTGPAEGLHFNLSHAGDWIVCGIGEAELGVDVEHVRDREITFAGSVLSGTEYAAWQALPEAKRPVAFYRLWTLKESYAKYRGEGLYLDFKTLEAAEESDGWWTMAGDRDCILFSRFLTSEDLLTVCAGREYRDELDQPVHRVDVEELVSFADGKGY